MKPQIKEPIEIDDIRWHGKDEYPTEVLMGPGGPQDPGTPLPPYPWWAKWPESGRKPCGGKGPGYPEVSKLMGGIIGKEPISGPKWPTGGGGGIK